ncbi:MAG TPA: YoaK family protein [Edaphobacter sp.]|jgi:uncharacterized membrane protein YoaK (UPF0700 family)
MPLFYLRRLTRSQRTENANRHLARYLAFIAGATNAGGLLAVGQYTSHMSGIVSAMADNLATGRISMVLAGLVAALAFLFGAILTTLLVRWARARRLESEYALPLLLEAGLLVAFGIRGRVFTGGHVLDVVMLLCFTMGLQNAIITKISDAVIRTTHLTGMVTDIGIALGRIVSAMLKGTAEIAGDEDLLKLRLLSSLIGLFFIGGLTGALGFKHVGFLFTLPLAVLLVVLGMMPVVDDLRRYLRTAS